ncbi:MAG: hypothetical protein IJ524_00265 [Bacteroidales bacterium]|nr:hypothetical protein [Bacteroidales bacterium]
MKKHLRSFFKLAAVALLGLTLATACGKNEEATTNDIPDFSIPELAGTSWIGHYSDVLNHNGTHQMLFTWTLDFNNDGQGMVMMEVTSPVIEEIVSEFHMTYSYDGSGKGQITYTGEDNEYTSEFLVDPMNRSLDVNLWMHFWLSEDASEPTLFGGRTTLYKVQK